MEGEAPFWRRSFAMLDFGLTWKASRFRMFFIGKECVDLRISRYSISPTVRDSNFLIVVTNPFLTIFNPFWPFLRN